MKSISFVFFVAAFAVWPAASQFHNIFRQDILCNSIIFRSVFDFSQAKSNECITVIGVEASPKSHRRLAPAVTDHVGATMRLAANALDLITDVEKEVDKNLGKSKKRGKKERKRQQIDDAAELKIWRMSNPALAATLQQNNNVQHTHAHNHPTPAQPWQMPQLPSWLSPSNLPQLPSWLSPSNLPQLPSWFSPSNLPWNQPQAQRPSIGPPPSPPMQSPPGPMQQGNPMQPQPPSPFGPPNGGIMNPNQMGNLGPAGPGGPMNMNPNMGPPGQQAFPSPPNAFPNNPMQQPGPFPTQG